MTLVVYSKSSSFSSHVNSVVEAGISLRSSLSAFKSAEGEVYIIHVASFTTELSSWLSTACQNGAIVALASEDPQVDELLNYTEIGVQGYFNAYMSAPNYQQMLRLLSNGQSWYPAPLLNQAFNLARSAVRRPIADALVKLTKRERDVALLVSKGMSNKLVARECDMSERTVKAHLTHIFKKLQVKDRVALAIYLSQFQTLTMKKSVSG